MALACESGFGDRVIVSDINENVGPRDAQRDWNCKARTETVNELPWESAIENDIVTYWNQGKSRC
ncbi:MAG: hypothetical protein WCA35_03500, partial [Kovacikia sp.]